MTTARGSKTRLALVRVVRAIVLVAVLPFVSAGALPAWAELAGLESPHVCHCARDHHGCVCAKCHTDPDAEMGVSSDSVKGRCGDVDVVGGAHGTPPAIFVAFVALRAPSASGRAPVATSRSALSRERLPPPPPPPRMVA